MTMPSKKRTPPVAMPEDVTREYHSGALPRSAENDLLTVLTSDKSLSKKFRVSDDDWIQLKSKNFPKDFKHCIYRVKTLDQMNVLMKHLQADNKSCLISGLPNPDMWEWGETERRTKQTILPDRMTSWLILDIDHMNIDWSPGDPAIDTLKAVRKQLTGILGVDAFSAVWHLTGSHDRPGSEHPRTRAFVRLSNPVMLSRLHGWVKTKTAGGLDPSILKPTQIVYTAPPTFIPPEAGKRRRVFLSSSRKALLIDQINDLPETVPQQAGLKPNSPEDAATAALVLDAIAGSSWHVKGPIRDGNRDKHYVRCPQEEQHTTDNGPSSTVLFIDKNRPAFHCLHAGCADLHLSNFIQALIDDEDIELTQQQIDKARRDAGREEFASPEFEDIKEKLNGQYLSLKRKTTVGEKKKRLLRFISEYDFSEVELGKALKWAAVRLNVQEGRLADEYASLYDTVANYSPATGGENSCPQHLTDLEKFHWYEAARKRAEADNKRRLPSATKAAVGAVVLDYFDGYILPAGKSFMTAKEDSCVYQLDSSREDDTSTVKNKIMEFMNRGMGDAGDDNFFSHVEKYIVRKTTKNFVKSQLSHSSQSRVVSNVQNHSFELDDAGAWHEIPRSKDDFLVTLHPVDFTLKDIEEAMPDPFIVEMVNTAFENTFVHEIPEPWRKDYRQYRESLIQYRGKLLAEKDGANNPTRNRLVDKIKQVEELLQKDEAQFLQRREELVKPLRNTMVDRLHLIWSAAITDNAIHKNWLLEGESQAGKSTFAFIPRYLAGHDNSAGCSVEDMKSDTGRRMYTLMNYMQHSDMLTGSVLTKYSNTLTDGDPISIKELYKDGASGYCRALLEFDCNALPKLRAVSHADYDSFTNRCLYMYFSTPVPERDRVSKQVFLKKFEEIASRTAAYALKILGKHWPDRAYDAFLKPQFKLEKERLIRWKQAEVPVDAWLKDNRVVVGGKENKVHLDQEYDAFCNWARSLGLSITSKHEFKMQYEQWLGFSGRTPEPTIGKKKAQGYFGVKKVYPDFEENYLGIEDEIDLENKDDDVQDSVETIPEQPWVPAASEFELYLSAQEEFEENDHEIL